MNDQIRTDRFSAFHDGEIPAVERDAIRAELAGSDTARRELADYKQLSQLLAELPVDRLGENFRAEVMQAAERRMLLPAVGELSAGRRRGLGRRWWPGAVALAASAAVLFLMVRLLDDRSAPNLENVARNDADKEAATAETPSDHVPEIAVTEDVGAPADISEPKDAPEPTVASKAVDATSGIVSRAAKVAAPSPVTNEAAIADNLDVSSPSSQLEFNEDLNEKQVGDFVNALDRTGKAISVVRLTVVDRIEGLEHLQLLLAQNQIPVNPAADEEKAIVPKERASSDRAKLAKKSSSKDDAIARDGSSADKDTALAEPSEKKKADDELICVLVKADGAQLSAALWQLRQEGQFQDLRVEDPPIEIAKLDEYVTEQGLAGVDEFDAPDGAQKPGEFAHREGQGKRTWGMKMPQGSGPLAKTDRLNKEGSAFEVPSAESPPPADSSTRARVELSQQQIRVSSRLLGNRGQVAPNSAPEIAQQKQESAAAKDNKPQATPRRQADFGGDERQRAEAVEKRGDAPVLSGPVQVLLVLVEGKSPPATAAPASPAKHAD